MKFFNSGLRKFYTLHQALGFLSEEAPVQSSAEQSPKLTYSVCTQEVAMALQFSLGPLLERDEADG